MKLALVHDSWWSISAVRTIVIVVAVIESSIRHNTNDAATVIVADAVSTTASSGPSRRRQQMSSSSSSYDFNIRILIWRVVRRKRVLRLVMGMQATTAIAIATIIFVQNCTRTFFRSIMMSTIEVSSAVTISSSVVVPVQVLPVVLLVLP